jgi:hypothetical protein
MRSRIRRLSTDLRSRTAALDGDLAVPRPEEA